MAAGIVFAILGLGGICLLLFRFATYAVPVLAGVTAGLWALGTDAGPIGAVLVGAAAGIATFVLFQLSFELTRSAAVRAFIAFAFAAPAAYVGYHAVLGLVQYGIPSETWRHVFAAAGAIIIGFAAVARLTDPAG